MPKKIIIFVAICFLFVAISGAPAWAAQVYLLPQTQTVRAGETFISELRLNTDGEQINAFDVTVLYPKDILEIKSVIEGGSVANLWIQKPTYSNDTGILLLQGGRTGGFSGEGFIIKILFEAKKSGTATVTFAPTSQILRNDGRGTPVLGIFSAARYDVGAAVPQPISITSKTHPDENEWYGGKRISLSWDLENNTQYSYTLSRDIIQNPDDIPEDSTGDVVYTDAEDGIYYFSIAESKDGRAWSPPVRRKFLHDNTPPEKFEILVWQQEGEKGKYFATFSAEDKTSGVARYEVKEFNLLNIRAEWNAAHSPYPLGEEALRSIIKVKAIDAAGNERVALFAPRTIQIIGNGLFVLLLGILIFVLKKFNLKHET